MKSLTQFLESQKFLIKGHTKSQAAKLTNVKELIKKLFAEGVVFQNSTSRIKVFALTLKPASGKSLIIYKNKLDNGVIFVKDNYEEEIIKKLDEFFERDTITYKLALPVVISYTEDMYKYKLCELIEAANGTVRRGGIHGTVTGTFTSKDDVIKYINSLSKLLD